MIIENINSLCTYVRGILCQNNLLDLFPLGSPFRIIITFMVSVENLKDLLPSGIQLGKITSFFCLIPRYDL